MEARQINCWIFFQFKKVFTLTDSIFFSKFSRYTNFSLGRGAGNSIQEVHLDFRAFVSANIIFHFNYIRARH